MLREGEREKRERTRKREREQKDLTLSLFLSLFFLFFLLLAELFRCDDLQHLLPKRPVFTSFLISRVCVCVCVCIVQTHVGASSVWSRCAESLLLFIGAVEEEEEQEGEGEKEVGGEEKD